LLVPTYLVLMLVYGAPLLLLTELERQFVLLVVITNTFVVPALGTYTLVRTGRASSIRLPLRRERNVPLLLALLGFASAAYLLWGVSPLLGLMLTAQAVAVGITWLITRYWLISAHAVAMGGAVGFFALMPLEMPTWGLLPLFITICLAIAVAIARLALKAHSVKQVLAGLFLGLSVALCSLAIR
jgi:membrane-associated phospholipid phosphatase